jgi:iron(III) transport system permease protein
VSWAAADRPGWLSRDGARAGRLVLAGIVVVAAMPFLRLAIAALMPAGTLDPGPAVAAFAAPSALRASLATIIVGLASSVLALVLGAGVAIVLVATDVRAKRVLALVFVGSLLVAPQVMALAFKTLAGPASPLLGALGLAPPPGAGNPMLGLGGIVLVLALHHAPLVAVTLAPGLRAIPQSLIEAALVEGVRAGPITLLIVLPLVRPHLLAAWLLALVAGAGNFGIPALLGVPAGVLTLPTLIYRQLTGFGHSIIADAASLSLVAGGLAAAGVLAGTLILGRSNTRLEAGAGLGPYWRLGRARRPVEALLWLVVGVTAVVPFLSLVATSVVPAYGVALTPASLTLAKFEEVLVRQDLTLRAFRNSLTLAAAAALLLMPVAITLAYLQERIAGRWRLWVAVAIETPYVIPGVVLAIAMILLFLRPLPLIGISIYATPAIILLAYMLRFLPVALKPVGAAMESLDIAGEEAAAVFGARVAARVRYIVLPALLPAAAAGGLLTFLMAFNELTVSALLWSAGSETLGVALLSLEEAGLAGEAAAVAVTATLIVAGLMLVLDRLEPWLPEGVLPWSRLVS